MVFSQISMRLLGQEARRRGKDERRGRVAQGGIYTSVKIRVNPCPEKWKMNGF